LQCNYVTNKQFTKEASFHNLFSGSTTENIKFKKMRKDRIKIFFEIKESIKKGEDNYKGLALPKLQLTGTYTQRNTYLNLVTQKIFNEYKKLHDL
jgi:hypothetical protein